MLPKYLILGISAWFVFGWTLNLILNPGEQLKPTVTTVIYWNIAFFLAAFGVINYYNLLWFLPLALLLPAKIMLVILRRNPNYLSTIFIFIISSLVLAPCLIYIDALENAFMRLF